MADPEVFRQDLEKNAPAESLAEGKCQRRVGAWGAFGEHGRPKAGLSWGCFADLGGYNVREEVCPN